MRNNFVVRHEQVAKKQGTGNTKKYSRYKPSVLKILPHVVFLKSLRIALRYTI